MTRTLALLVRQVRYVNKAFWRNPASAFFTFAMPLMFLVIFTSLLGSFKVRVGDVHISSATYYVASMATFALITACYTNVAMNVTFQRDLGILKRTRGTPLPPASYFGARVVHALGVAVLLVVLTAAFGHFFYHAQIPSGATLARFVAMLLVGAAAFSALGFAVASIVPNADAAPAVVNATILPLLFLSGIFIPLGNSSPAWIRWIARVFPVEHFAAGMQAGFLGTHFSWGDVLVVAAWGAAGLLFAVRRFTWEPRT